MTLETHSFQAEVQQLLQLMIHSLYSNKEIFLRELISNASDALDKLRFEEVKNASLNSQNLEPSIRLSVFSESKRLVIEDTGIGMTKADLVANLGTIANSGTRKFLESLSDAQKKDSSLIGQFGVGFYAAFMVADTVRVESCSGLDPEGKAWVWESNGQGQYTLSPGSKSQRGTTIELHLKDEAKEFLEEWRVKGIVKKYSDFITYPILFVDAENKEERLNTSTPLWAKNKKEVSEDDYNALYKQLSKDFNPPLLHEHISTEGLTPFQSIVFIPKEAPFDLYTRDNHGLHLYVRRVCISEKCKELIPEYLRFVSGVVETDELPLNVSREMLQHNTKIGVIKKNVVKKVLNSLITLSTNEIDKYLEFYKIFGPVLKEGFHFDSENHEQLAKLVRFRTSKTGPNEWVSLDTYWERKASGQTELYYISGMSYEAVSSSPHLEALNAKGIEVLFLTDPIDEWLVMDYPKHNGQSFKSVVKGDLDLRGVGEDTAHETSGEDNSPGPTLASLLEAFRGHLKEEIKDVKVSKRLRESPVCLVAEESGLSAQMERLIKSQNKDFVGTRKYLEINPTHPIIKNMLHMKETNPSDNLQDWIEILYDTALISEGSQIKDPGAFAKKLTKIIEMAAGASKAGS